MKLSDFSIFDAQKDNFHELIYGFNQTKTNYPCHRSVHSLFSEQAYKTPDAVAVIHEEQSLTYERLDALSNQVARFLVDRGLASESFVAVMLDRSVHMVVALVGILKAGCAYVPINDDLPFERIKYMLRQSQVHVLISEKRHIRTVNKLQWECPDLKTILCIDSKDIYSESEEAGQMMKEETWDYLLREVFDDISGGGWKSSYTGQWLSRQVMNEYGENIRLKLEPYLDKTTRILEIGCASGISMFRLAPRVSLYYGTDLNQKILQWTEKQRQNKGLDNIRLRHLAAHNINQLEEKHFDIVILNSVIQCFSGHNYLRKVLRKAIDLMKDRGLLFLGNLWDQDLKDDFVRSLEAFEKTHRNQKKEGYRTKTDRSEELFLSRAFLEDLQHDFPKIKAIEHSKMLGQAESELSEYGYDAIVWIDKHHKALPEKSRHREQLDNKALSLYSDTPLEDLRNVGPHSLAYIIYTSGTTGQPKGVMIEHRGIVRLVVNTNYIELGPSDRILQTGSLAFDASTFEIWGALLNGGAVCFPKQEQDLLDADRIGYLIKQHGITTMFLTTSLFNMLVGTKVHIFQGLKTLLTGGEKVSVHHFNIIRKAFPSLALKHVYGPTENTTFTTSYDVKTTFNKDIPIGKPIANTTVYILDNTLNPLPVGFPGELCTSGNGVGRGYIKDQSLTEKKFVSNPFQKGESMYRTGDLARWLPDGNIEFLGRIDEQVKIRGYRIEPEEIVYQLLQHEAVKEAVVVAKDLGADSKELVAYVTANNEGFDVNELRDYLKTVFPEYMIPTYFIKLDKLPLTPNGKVDKRALPEPEEMLKEEVLSPHSNPPETETEKQLASIWEEVLGCKGIGLEDNFFDSGGHSLKVVKLIALIQKKMGVSVPLTVIFKAPTIGTLARYILDSVDFGVEGIDKAMILLNGKNSGGNIFAFPPGTGDALGYIQLAEALKPYCFYAFNFIENKALIKHYGDLIMDVDPKGPYVLFGYSSGGNLAYHVAHELETRCRSVCDILMVDSARYLEKVPILEEEVRQIAFEFLSHESVRSYLGSPILKEKALQRIQSSYRYISNSVDHVPVHANIHVLLCDNPTGPYTDSSGRILVSTQGWAEVSLGTFTSYHGVGDHKHMLSPPYLRRNAMLIKEMFDHIFNSLKFRSNT